MTKKTIEIFRAGTHISSDGKRYTFSEADVQAIAAAYDKGKFLAPVVIGHPIKSDAPAYAWADAVRVRDDGVMEADLEKVNPAFAELVDKGAYKKVSTAFYPAEHPNNPTPGQLHIRHIGFLGAAAPGVQGLAPVEFAEGDDDGLISFALGEEFRPLVWLARSLGRVMRRHRDQIIAEDGVEAADKQMPEYEIESAIEAATRLDQAIERPGPRFSEGEPSAETAARAAELDQREADIAAREQAAAARDAETAKAQADADRTARQAEDAAFAEGLVAAGRLPDGHTSLILGFCDALGSAEMIAFAEGEDAQDPRQAFKAYLTQNLGVAIRFDELAGGDGLKFAEGQSAEELGQLARARVAEANARGEHLSVSAAMAAITAGR